MPAVNNSRAGVNSGTSLQATLKNDATTYFAKVDIGADGSGSLDQSEGQSKGLVLFSDAPTIQESGSYIFAYPRQQVWLGSPSITWVSGGLNEPVNDGDVYVPRVTIYDPALDLSAFNIDGITTQAVVKVSFYQLSGSTEATRKNPPSGSSIYLTVVGTTSPVF